MSRDIKEQLDNLESKVAAGNHYEALQLYKTFYFRYCRNQRKLYEAQRVLVDGSCALLKHGYSTDGTELAMMFITFLKEQGKKITDEILATLTLIFNSYARSDAKKKNQEKISFMKEAIKWSGSEGLSKNELSLKQGHPELHYLMARYFSDELSDYGTAQQHFLHSSKPLEFSQMLVKWSTFGHPNESDLFIARAILLFLTLPKTQHTLKNATILYNNYTQSLQVNTPLSNYLRFLLQTLEKAPDSVGLFETLKNKYTPSLSRDPSFLEYLKIIAQNFYNVRSGPSQGEYSFPPFVEQMMRNLLGGSVTDGPEVEDTD